MGAANGPAPILRGWLAVVALCFLAVVIGYTDRVNISVAAIAMRSELGWTQTTKGVVLAAFFAGYLSCMALSGWLATRFGGRWLLLVAVTAWSAFTFATPWAARESLGTLLAVRVGMGVGESAMFPACYELLGRHVSAGHRTRAVAMVLSGIAIGTVCGLVSCGWIVAHLGWPMAFHLFGALGIAWIIAWVTTTARLDSGRTLAASQVRALGPSVPWRIIFSSTAVRALFVTHFCSNWALYFFLAWLPTYFVDVRGLSLALAGVFAAGPWLVMALATNVAGWYADRTVRRGRPLVKVRKTLQSIGLFVPAVSLLVLLGPISTPVSLGLVALAVGALGCTWAGCSANAIDLAPRHSAAIMGVSNTFATVPGVVGVSLTGWIVQTTGTFQAAFVLTAVLCVIGAIVYVLYASGDPIID